MNDSFKKLDTVKAELDRKQFQVQGVSAQVLIRFSCNSSNRVWITLFGGDGKQAEVPYEEAVRIIRSAPDPGAMWSTLEAEGLMRPRMEGSGDGLETKEDA